MLVIVGCDQFTLVSLPRSVACLSPHRWGRTEPHDRGIDDIDLEGRA